MIPIACDGLFVYTDGGSRPNPGFSGSGVVLCYYLKDTIYPTIRDGYVATTIGFVKQNEPYRHSVKIVKEIHISIPYANETNNRAELNAILYAISSPDIYRPKEITICTDSQYCCNGVVNWMYKWKSDGWVSNGKSVSNVDLWSKIYDSYLKLKKTSVVLVKWVKGHSDNPGNVIADQLATQGIQRSTRRDYSVYSSTVIDLGKEALMISPLLSMSRLYFTNDRDIYKQNRHYMTSEKSKDIVGKFSDTVCFAVIDVEDRVINELIEFELSRPKLFQSIAYIKLDVLRNKKNYDIYEEQRTGCLKIDPSTGFTLINDEPVICHLRKGDYPVRVIDTLIEIEGIYELSHTNHNKIKLMDITNDIYEKYVKKSRNDEIELTRLKACHTVGTDQIETSHGRVYLGLDFPTRNTLKKIEVNNPVVTVVEWERTPGRTLRAGMIESEIGSGFWCNYYPSSKFKGV